MTSQQTITKSRAPAGTIRAAIPIILLLGLVTLIGALRPSFLTADTLLVVMADTATLFILAAGITFVVMLGGIDLSIQAVASLSSVIVAITLSHIGYWAFPATLLVGFITGAFSGVVHVWLRIPSFIVTLATSGLVAAAALLLSQERSITIGETGRAYLSWITGRPFGIPSVIVVGAVVAVVGIWLQRYTPFGRYSTAIGAGEAATWASGVKVNRQKVIAYSLSAGLAALAGILLTGRLSSGSPTLANELLLPAIASVVVGGTSITGGAGGIGRTVIGALIISVVRVGMTFVGVDIFAQQIVFG
ncbi:MAG: ribose transport system permease protein, partial [Verrucomicrobiota bacterium]|nr:ribose transport system permease protein [Verrucomicrobiota bacterium]